MPARRVLRALLRAGFEERHRRGSHRFLVHESGKSLLFAFHEGERLGPKILAKMLKDAGISQDEFRKLL
jgi:predicted RNA binding protein YcfA (HicA-like mRNA interferase family)